jgi:hypothetical protein
MGDIVTVLIPAGESLNLFGERIMKKGLILCAFIVLTVPAFAETLQDEPMLGVKPKINSEIASAHNILAEFKVAKQGDPILLPVKFKGKEYLFVLDIGCSMTTFDTSLISELGDVKEIARAQTGGGDMIDTQLFDAPEAFFGPLNLRDCVQVICVDIGILGLISGRKISGVLGMNFLKKYVV